MPSNEYSAVGGGGRLKLKGSKVKDGRVDKPRKKKKHPEQQPPEKSTEAEKEQEQEREQRASSELILEKNASDGDNNRNSEKDDDSDGKRVVYKTEAERKYEEQRKKRVCIHISSPCQMVATVQEKQDNLTYNNIVKWKTSSRGSQDS